MARKRKMVEIEETTYLQFNTVAKRAYKPRVTVTYAINKALTDWLESWRRGRTSGK